MRSRSKTDVSRDAAQAICADAFGSDAAIRTFRELPDGYFNAAYLIEAEGAPPCVLKVAPPDDVPVLRYERNIIHAEVEVLRLVRERTTLPAPEVYHFDSSRRLLGSPFFLMSVMPGTTLDKLRGSLADDQLHTIDRQLGAYLRQMNDITGPAFGYIAPGARQAASWREAFLGILDDVLDDGRAMGVALPRPAEAIRAQVERCAPMLDAVNEPRLVHWDLWDGNVFIDRAACRVTGLIDFERSLWGDPLLELQLRELRDPEAFVEGYGRRLFATPDARTRRILYNLHLFLIMVIEAAYRQYETSDLERWSRERLDETLAQLDAALA